MSCMLKNSQFAPSLHVSLETRSRGVYTGLFLFFNGPPYTQVTLSHSHNYI